MSRVATMITTMRIANTATTGVFEELLDAASTAGALKVVVGVDDVVVVVGVGVTNVGGSVTGVVSGWAKHKPPRHTPASPDVSDWQGRPSSDAAPKKHTCE